MFGNEHIFSVEYLNWLYAKNPLGKVFGFDAYFDDELVAHYVTVPVEYSFNGNVHKGLLSLNTATKKNKQGNGLFTRLAKKTIESASNNGYKFIIGVANQNSTYGFINKLGFKLICPLKTQIGIGIIKYKLNSTLLQSSNSDEFLKWRFSKPSTPYSLNSRGEIVLPRAFKFINICLSVSSLKSDINKNSFAIFNTYIYTSPHLVKRGVFFSIPTIFKPSPLNLIFLSLDNELQKIDDTNIHFECFNFDAF